MRRSLCPTRFKWLTLSLLISLVLLLTLTATLGQTQTSPPFTPPPGPGPWVVRAYFTDRSLVDALAAWREPWEVHHERGYLVLDVTRAEYQRLLAAGFRLEIDADLTARLNQPNRRLPGQTEGIPGYPCYRTVEETFEAAQSIADAHPDLATWRDIGDSWVRTDNPDAGYDIKVLRLTNTAIPGPKPKLFVVSAIHAREYTPAELSTRFAEYLIDHYGEDADATWLLDYHEIHLVLQANPDGRKKAETGLLWRKNANNNYCSNSDTRGADLNRNFSFYWNSCDSFYECSSGNPCAETYRGPDAASEPETQAIQDYVRTHFSDQREDDLTAAAPITATGIFLDLHSYSELVLWPWGFTATAAPNGTALQTLGRKLAYFNGYEPQQAVDLYPTDGTTDDFAYGELGLAAYTFELGTWFFQSCDSFENTILPTNLPALLYAAKVSRTPYLTPAGPDVVNISVTPGRVDLGETLQVTAALDDSRFNHANGAEPVQNVVAAELYVDVPPWVTATTPIAVPMAAADGSWDAPVEIVSATVKTSGWHAGRHILFVRGQDAEGNWGALSAAFVELAAPTPPTVTFSSNSPVVLGYTTVFTNQTSGAQPLTYGWDFGDGLGTSVARNPTYTYLTTGTFTVTLTATNSLGSDSLSQRVHVLTPYHGVALTATQVALTGTTGQKLVYRLSVTNGGNITDRYRLETGGNRWTTTLSISRTEEIPPARSAPVQVTVTVPSSSSVGVEDAVIFDAVTLTATSLGDTTQTDRLQLTTTAVRFDIYLPLLLQGF